MPETQVVTEPQLPGPVQVDGMALIARAIDKGMPPEQLGPLFDLVNRIEKERAIRAYNLAMNACQNEVPCIVRDAKNKQKDSRYTRLETIMHTVKAIAMKHGFSLGFSAVEDQGKMLVSLEISHIEGYSKTFTAPFAFDGTGAKGGGVMSETQGCVSTTTYAQRALVTMAFSLTIADTDLDGERYLTAEQIGVIDGIIDEIKDTQETARENGKPIAKPFTCESFMKWLAAVAKVEKLDHLAVAPAAVYPKAVFELKRKLKEVSK